MARSSVAELPTSAADGLHVRRPVKYELNRRRLVGRAAQRREKMIAFGYYGGKLSHLDFILPLLPTSYRHYCEPFGGSAAVLINRKPALVETYNDVDSEVANFFTCLRDEGDELIRLISLTPFSREELVRAHKQERGLTPLERARRFFVRARQTRTVWLRRAGKNILTSSGLPEPPMAADQFDSASFFQVTLGSANSVFPLFPKMLSCNYAINFIVTEVRMD